MLSLSSPNLLFNDKRLFHINDFTGEKFSATGTFKTLLVYEYQEPELPESLKAMAVKILQACQFKPEETAFINIRQQKDATLNLLANQYHPELILIFGDIHLSRNMAGLKKNMPYSFGKLKMLRTETLDSLEKNAQEKQALWMSLKKMLQL